MKEGYKKLNFVGYFGTSSPLTEAVHKVCPSLGIWHPSLGLKARGRGKVFCWKNWVYYTFEDIGKQYFWLVALSCLLSFEGGAAVCCGDELRLRA